MSSSLYQQILKNDLGVLQRLLREQLRTHFCTTNKRENMESLRVLNLACGRADESGILTKVLRPFSSSLQVIGVDIRDRELDEARALWKSNSEVNFAFLHHDATKLHEIDELSTPFDIAFMRHQNYWNGDLTWKRIYDSALHRLKDNGLLIITSYFDREHLLALQAIQQLGATLLATVKNPKSRDLHDAPNKSVDRHVAVFRVG